MKHITVHMYAITTWRGGEDKLLHSCQLYIHTIVCNRYDYLRMCGWLISTTHSGTKLGSNSARVGFVQNQDQIMSPYSISWETKWRTRPHMSPTMTACVCYLFSAIERFPLTELCSCGCQTTHRHTCWGSWMFVHTSSLTCPKNSTALYTKSSEMQFRETFSTLLCTRLPAGRQVGKDWALHFQIYTSLTTLT